ncbi:hypothetical protein ROLI_001940 [Roseobacter fucihabitans]|uniref:Uncharacterized protein n=1 Tax=Roseobacter fucihabitans TaxID=1537242 RepID=A0ABZ2BM00_9RHOB|nr:hypothetical protein [Roseobacter litoralis]
MIADGTFFFWPKAARARSPSKPPKPRSSPVFIGDCIQPWGGDTMLLHLWRRDEKDDQPSE